MSEITVLEGQLIEEYYRCLRMLAANEEAISELPKGYISHKLINGKIRHYLQWREDNKIKSKYLNDKEFLEMDKSITLRKRCEKGIKNAKKDMKQIERAVGKELIKKYRNSSLNI